MLGDADIQQSSKFWLQQRPASLPPVATWVIEAGKVPTAKPPQGTTHVVIDTPAGLGGGALKELVQAAGLNHPNDITAAHIMRRSADQSNTQGSGICRVCERSRATSSMSRRSGQTQPMSVLVADCTTKVVVLTAPGAS